MEATNPLRRGLWLVAVAALAACSKPGPSPGPATPPARAPGDANMVGFTQQPPPPRRDTATPSSGSISIDERILRICGDLPEPRFELDSASIRDEAADKLSAVARCFTVGPLKGKTVKLVGRADPRGTEMYNLALGQERAASVARFLESAGIPRANIHTMSRGEIDASGTDEQGWARDRRVDIVLGDATPEATR